MVVKKQTLSKGLGTSSLLGEKVWSPEAQWRRKERVTVVGNPGLHLTGYFLRYFVKHASGLSYWELRTLRYLCANFHPLSVQGRSEERGESQLRALLHSPTYRPSVLPVAWVPFGKGLYGNDLQAISRVDEEDVGSLILYCLWLFLCVSFIH